MFSKIKLSQFFKLKNIHQYEIYNFLKKNLTSKLVRVKNSKLYNAIKKFEDFILKNEEVKLKFTILKNEELMVFADSLINFNTSYLINFELETYSINDEAFIPISLILKNFPLSLSFPRVSSHSVNFMNSHIVFPISEQPFHESYSLSILKLAFQSFIQLVYFLVSRLFFAYISSQFPSLNLGF